MLGVSVGVSLFLPVVKVMRVVLSVLGGTAGARSAGLSMPLAVSPLGLSGVCVCVCDQWTAKRESAPTFRSF